MNRRKYVLIIIVLLTIFTSYLTLLNSVPFIGIRLAEDDEGSYFVNSLIDVGWGYHNGVKIGDQVVLINKKNPKLTPSVINYKAIENVDSITLYRDGRFERSYIINTVNSSQQFIFYFLIPTLYFIVCLVLSLFLYTKHTTNSSTILIYLLLSVSISYISACLKLKLFPFVQYIQYLTFLVSPILYLHFIYEYMKENNSVWFSKKVLYFLYLVALIGFGSYFSFENDEIILRVFLLILCCLLFILINGLFFIKNSGIKETYRWFFYSIALALGPFLLFTLIPDIFFNKILVRGELTSIFFFTVPLFFLFSVVSGKVYALTLFIKQLPYYSAISFFITSVIATVYFGLASSTMNFELIINVLLLLFILIITSFYFKNSLDRTLRKSLFVSKHFYQQSLYRYSEQLKKEKDLEGIIEALLRELKEVLGSKELDVILISKRSGIICIESKALLNMYKSLITKVRQDYQHIGKVTQFNNSFSVVFGEREDYRFVLLGKCKKNLTGLGEEQVDWLATLAYYRCLSR